MAKIVSVWEVMHLTSPSYLFDLKVHLYFSQKNQEEGQQSQILFLWKEEEVLYNSKHEKYYNKDEKQRAWKRIPSKLISRGFSEIADAQISEKITSIPRYYSSSRKKKRQKLVMPEPQMSMFYVSFWRFINDLDLLNDNLIPIKSYSSIDLETEDPAGNNMFKVNNRNTRTRGEICSKLTIKIPDRRHWRRSSIFIANFEQISHLVLVFLLLTLISKCRLGRLFHLGKVVGI